MGLTATVDDAIENVLKERKLWNYLIFRSLFILRCNSRYWKTINYDFCLKLIICYLLIFIKVVVGFRIRNAFNVIFNQFNWSVLNKSIIKKTPTFDWYCMSLYCMLYFLYLPLISLFWEGTLDQHMTAFLSKNSPLLLPAKT